MSNQDFILTTQPGAVQVKSVALEASRAQVASIAFPGPRGPAGENGEDGVAIKGPWDMTSGGGGSGVTSYPLDGDPTVYDGGDAVPFETIAGDSHGFTVQEGSIAGFVAQLALTDHQVQEAAAGGTVGNLLIPETGIVAAEFLHDTTAEAAPGAGTVVVIQSLFFADVATQRQLALSIVFGNSSGNQLVSTLANYYEGGSQVWQAQQFTEPLTLPGESRGSVYIDGATRQVGIILNGVDKGWLLDNVTSDPVVLAPEVTGVAIQKIGYWISIPAEDPIIGATVSAVHNIDPATMADAGLMPEAPQEWNAVVAAELPEGAEPGDVFEVTVGGRYPGSTYVPGDLAVVRSNGTSVTRLPASSISATESAAAIAAAVAGHVAAADPHGDRDYADSAVAALNATVATAAELPASAENAGREIYVESTRCYFRSNGPAWVQTSTGRFTHAEAEAAIAELAGVLFTVSDFDIMATSTGTRLKSMCDFCAYFISSGDSVTGPVGETLLRPVDISNAAKYLGPKGEIEVTASFTCPTSSNQKNVRIRLGTASGVTGTVWSGSFTIVNNRGLFSSSTIQAKGSDTSQAGPSPSVNARGGTFGANLPSTASVDMLGGAVFLNITAEPAAAESVTLNWVRVQIKRGY